MAKKTKQKRPAARLPKGMRDIGPAEIRTMNAMIASIREVYESYGFEPLETPAFEFTDALGKFLPDADRPNEGVFSFQDEDDQWLSLRYDQTAPLARFVAQNFDALPKPFRRYAVGPVWRNEKPGPGRFRQFMQFDADTVGTTSIAADAEMCMLAADTMEKLGIERGDYVIKVNNRKVLDGVMEAIGLDGEDNAKTRLTVLRAIDKLDRLGISGVEQLLGQGRKDESGDYTKGAGLNQEQSTKVISFVSVGAAKTGKTTIAHLRQLFSETTSGMVGLDELDELASLVESAGYGNDRIRIDSSVVRGLDYYTGPVFEAELTFEVKDDNGQPMRFGSVGGGGRYDDLVTRFTGRPAPATGFSIGISRLQAALQALGRQNSSDALGTVVVLVMDFNERPRYLAMVQALRTANIRAEMYLGTSGMKAQMKYADKRGAPCVIIQGEDELAIGQVQIKDLIEGAKAAQSIKDNKEWKSTRPAQFAVDADKLVEAVTSVIARHTTSDQN